MVSPMVTAIQEFLPNGQVNGYCHQELFTGYKRFENIFCCLLQFSQLLQLYFHLLIVKSLKTLKPSYFPQKTLSQAGLFSNMTMVTEDFLLNGQWSRKVFSPMVSPMVTAIQEFSPMVSPMVMVIQNISPMVTVTTSRNRPYGKAWTKPNPRVNEKSDLRSRSRFSFII